MTNYITELITLFAGGFATWLWQRLKTRREQKKSDLTLINEAITPLLESVRSLTEQYGELIKKFVEEQEKNLLYLQENINLRGVIEQLEAKVENLTKEIAELKKQKQ